MTPSRRTKPSTAGRRLPAVLAAATALMAAVTHCNASSASPDGLFAGGAPGSGGAGGDAFASATPGDAAAVADSSVQADALASTAADGASSDRPRGDDASSSPAEDSDAEASAPGAWAAWPMPNAPSSGLPNPQSYDTSIAGVAIDRVTGLMWQRGATLVSEAEEGDATSILEQAAAVCAQLNLAEYDDWRVPSRIELVSLLDFAEYPASNASVFPAEGEPLGTFYLSSSQHALGTPNATVGEVWLNDPGVLYASISALPSVLDAAAGATLQGPDAVRCVRGQGSASGPHYMIGSGVVRDNWTGLTWVQSPSSLMQPSAVESYCESLAQNGGGWRAPSANELETLWGDSSDPDTVGIDSDAFPATAQLNQGLGSADTYVGPGADSGATAWVDVVGFASTNRQEDVFLTTTIEGFESAEGYWFYAQCVR